jgi:anaerobic ribonucleoside-triphosphate reductase activating protein
MENQTNHATSSEMQLYLYHREPSTEALGPGKRYVIWVQGCELNCPGCLVPDTHSVNSGGTRVSLDVIFQEINSIPNLRGVTFSGGEPFLQAKALAALSRMIKTKTSLDIISFSGYTFEQLIKRGEKNTEVLTLLSLLDLLIDGAYVEDLNQGQWMRGSANQRIHHLSNLYQRYEQQMNELKNRSVEVKIRPTGDMFIVGVPPVGFADDWQRVRQHIYSKEMGDPS